jgi:uncharacterized protein
MSTIPSDPRDAFTRVDDALQRQAFEEVLRLATPWAQLGHGWAEACIGSLYQCGLGVPRSRESAIHYFERAAAHGFAGAWYALGVIYEVGDQDVPSHPQRAADCYRRAHELGYFPGKPFTFD